MKGGVKLIADEGCKGCYLSWSQMKRNQAISFVANKRLVIMCNKQRCSGLSLLKWHGCYTFPTLVLQGCVLHWVANPCFPAFMCFLLKGKKWDEKGTWSLVLSFFTQSCREIYFFSPNTFSIFRSLSFVPKWKATYSGMLPSRLMSCELRVPAVKWWIRVACCCGHIPVERETTAPLASLVTIPYLILLQCTSEASYDLSQPSFVRAVGFTMAQDNPSCTTTLSPQPWACLTTPGSWEVTLWWPCETGWPARWVA